MLDPRSWRRIAPMTDDRGLELFVPNRTGGFVTGEPLAPPMCMDVFIVAKLNPEGHRFFHIDSINEDFSCNTCHTGGIQKE